MRRGPKPRGVPLCPGGRGLMPWVRIRAPWPETLAKGTKNHGGTQEKTFEHPREQTTHELENRDALPVALPPPQPEGASAPGVRRRRVLRCRGGGLPAGVPEAAGA